MKSEKALLSGIKHTYGPLEIVFQRAPDSKEREKIGFLIVAELHQWLSSRGLQDISMDECVKENFLWEPDECLDTFECSVTDYVPKDKGLLALWELIFRVDLLVPVYRVAFCVASKPKILEDWEKYGGVFTNPTGTFPQFTFAKPLTAKEKKAILECIAEYYRMIEEDYLLMDLDANPSYIIIEEWGLDDEGDAEEFIACIKALKGIVPIEEVAVGVRVYW